MLHAKKKWHSLTWLFMAAVLLLSAGCGSAPVAPATTAAPATAAAPAVAPTTALPAEISVSEAAAKREAGAFILDVRQPDEWQAVHIPGATLIPLDQLAARLNEVPTDKEIVVVCRSGNRSKAGRDTLTAAGYTQVTSMAGGLNQWTAAGLPTTTGP